MVALYQLLPQQVHLQATRCTRQMGVHQLMGRQLAC
jgi:hypothetical protein